MDAKDLRIETALGERNDGNKYSQSGVALQCYRNKSYQDIGSNPLAKAEAAVRPCAVIGPDRVVPPASNEAYLKKASVLWSYPDNPYPRPTDFPHKPLNSVNPSRNISPRQTFQENMQRIMVPPTYSAVKLADESTLNLIQDRNAAVTKNTKQTLAPEAKYCDVPYTVNLLTNEHKNVRETEMCVTSVNSPLARTVPHGWPPSGVNLNAPRTYGAHDVYQYPQYLSCAGPRPPVVPMARPHRTFQEDGGYVYPDPYYQEASVRFKPYPSMKERYPPARYDYININNYPSPFHPPPPYASHKYDIPNTRPPHPYHMKYLDNRIPDANIEGYQRPNQQSVNYNMPFRNQVIPPTYAPALGNTQNKLPMYPPDRSSNKHSLDNSKAYVDYENAKAKYSLSDNYYDSEMARVHQIQKPVAMPNYASPGIHTSPMQQYHRKDNIPIKTYEYMPHYRHCERSLGFNHPPQFSPSILAISPTDSNASNDTTQTQGTSQDDCGYASQTSSTSARSIDSNFTRLHNEHYRRYDYRYRPIIGNAQMLPKSDQTVTNSKEKDKIDVRQFLSMWNEGDDENTNNNTKEMSLPNNYRHQETAKSQDQLYVLDLVNVPSEELAKYEHIQKVSKLPENIKGYNNIEILNQFEEVIESSNMNIFKSSTSKVFMPIKDRKNAIKQIVEVLPRPVSPLDVESKISQSVIHKEVGCNFEIKPCSPKMMNVEIAAPIHNILGERAIEKVSNPHSNKAKTPLSMRIDGNTVCNTKQRQEITHTPYENVSCKMIGSPFTANNMESVKTNYSLHDLETSSGVCLASLPRLDNEIELNFPEVNQQFINANKASCNMHEEKIIENNLKLDSPTHDNNSIEKNTIESVEDSCTELTKLSQYRKVKVNSLEHQEDESNANAIRKDSVIIENPENVRKCEENRDKIFSQRTDEEENTPMNLTSNNSSYKNNESNTTKSTYAEMESALDFSINKSENGLPLIDSYDDVLINTAQKNTNNVASYFNDDNQVKQDSIEGSNQTFKLPSECDSNESNTKTIIVRNNQNANSECKTTEASPCVNGQTGLGQLGEKTLLKSDECIINHVESNNFCDIEPKTNETNFDGNKTITKVKTSSTNVIVKHKNKFKTSTSKADNKASILNQKLHSSHIKNEKERSFLDVHRNDSYVVDSEHFEQKSNHSKSVIQNNSFSDKTVRIEAEVSDIYEDKMKSSSNSLGENHNTTMSESDYCEEKRNKILEDTSVNGELVDNTKESKSTESNDGNKLKSNRDVNYKINSTIPLISEKSEIFKSNDSVHQTHKYYNDLINESELFIDKTYCVSAINRSSSNSIKNEENETVDVIKILDCPTEVNVEHNFVSEVITVTTENVLEKNKISEPSASATKREISASETGLSQDKLCCINNDELNINLFDDDVFIDNAANENHKELNESFENSGMVNCLVKEIKVVDVTAKTTFNNKQHSAAVSGARVSVCQKYSIDSGYQSSKNSFAGNDDGFMVYSGHLSKDTVFVEQKTRNNKITFKDSAKNTKDISDKSILTSTPLLGTINDNKTSDDKQELGSKISQSSNIYDNVDANMEILFAQQNDEVLSEKCIIDSMDFHQQTDEDLAMALNSSQSKIECNNAVIDQQLLDTENIANKMDVENDFDNQDENSHNINSDLLKDNKVVGEPCRIVLNKNDGNNEVHEKFIKKHSGHHGKKLFSPWIQKLMTYIEGKTNKPDIVSVNETKLQSKDVFKSLEDPNVNLILQKHDDEVVESTNNVDKFRSCEEPSIVNVMPVFDVEALEEFNIDNIVKNYDVKTKLFDQPNICSLTLKNDVEVMSLAEPNIADNIQENDVEGKLPEKPNIFNVVQSDDVTVKPFEDKNVDSIVRDGAELELLESNIDSISQKVDVNVKQLELRAQYIDFEVNSLEKPNNTLQSDFIEVISLNEPNIDNVIQSNDIKIKSLKELDVDSIGHGDDDDNMTPEETNIDNIQGNDVKVKLPEVPYIDNVGQSDGLEIKLVEKPDNATSGEPNVDSILQKNEAVVMTLVKPNDDKYIGENDVEVKLPELPNIDNVVVQVNEVTVKSFEDNDVDSSVQSDDVKVNSIDKPDSVFLTDDVNDKPLNISMADRGIKATLVEVCSDYEGTLIKEDSIKTDVELKKNNYTNISMNSNESICASDVSIDVINNFISDQDNTIEVNVIESSFTEEENKSELDNDCVDELYVQNDLIDTQEISFNYPNNSIISQITGNILNNDRTLEKNAENDEIKRDDKIVNSSSINKRRSLKRSFSDSALNVSVCRSNNPEGQGKCHYSWTPKRNRTDDFDNNLSNNRRNSVSIEENVAFCIVIDDNCIITEENDEKICIAELQEDYITEIETSNDCNNAVLLKDFEASAQETDVDITDSTVLQCDQDTPMQNSWDEEVTCADDVFSDEVAENVVISAPSSPTDSTSDYEYDDSGIYGSTSTCSHTDKVKFLHGEKMSEDDAQIVETLYRTPHMKIMNKTLLYGDKNVESDNDQENILLESDEWKPSPPHSPDYIDPTHTSNDFSLETPENKENVFVKELSPLRRIDDYLDVSSAENETDEHILPHNDPEPDETTQDGLACPCESSLDNVFDYKLKDESEISTTTPSSSSSPEVSSTTSEEKSSAILLKITNLNGSRVSQIHEIETNNRPRCKFTEKKEYSTSNLKFPNRPLMTKAAQKYIPPIKESIRDLKVKITLPQQSLLKFKQLKLSRNEPKVHKSHNVVPRIAKKPKPNFDDVLKSIDEIQIKRQKEKSKKAKTVIVPKVLIKKNENGSHYASTPKRDVFSPDLTGRKWQPWVFLEKNHFIDKMAIKNKTTAIFNHRKKSYVLAEKFKKYKSVGSAKFVISQPKTPGQLKYTIRLKHTF